MTTFLETQTFYVQDCIDCGAQFGVPIALDKRLRDNGKLFYCPSGHPQSYGETKASRLERELAREKAHSDQIAARAEENQRRADAVGRRLSAQKGVVTKLKNKIKDGQCPCCGKQFHDLRKHIAKNHPYFAEAKKVIEEMQNAK